MSSYLHNFGSSPLLHKSLLFPFGKTCSSFENIITHCPVYDAHGCSVKEPGRKWNGNLPFTNKLRLGGFLKVPNQNPPMATLCTECHGHHCPWCSWLFLVWSQLLPPAPLTQSHHTSSSSLRVEAALPLASAPVDLSSWCFRLLMCTWLAPPHLPGLNPNVFCCPYFLLPQKNLSAAIKAFQLIDWMRAAQIVKNNLL